MMLAEITLVGTTKSLISFFGNFLLSGAALHSHIPSDLRHSREYLVFSKRSSEHGQSLTHTPHSLFSLAALERTYLGYLRTSLALSVLAVIIAQLFRLQHLENPNKDLGFFIISIPLACICIAAAVIVLLLGTYRFWRQQNAILRGKVYAGGWEVNAIGGIMFSVRDVDINIRHLTIPRLCSPFSCSW